MAASKAWARCTRVVPSYVSHWRGKSAAIGVLAADADPERDVAEAGASNARPVYSARSLTPNGKLMPPWGPVAQRQRVRAGRQGRHGQDPVRSELGEAVRQLGAARMAEDQHQAAQRAAPSAAGSWSR